MSTLTHVQAKDNQPLTLNGITGRIGAKDVLVSGSPSRINMIDCQAINLLPADERLLVEGVGNGSQQALVRELEQFTQTWPRSVMSSGQSVYELPMLARIITEIGGGVSQNVWMTPTANLAEHPGQVAWKQGQQVNNPQLHPKSAKREILTTPANLWDQVANMKRWPTPTASDIISKPSHLYES